MGVIWAKRATESRGVITNGFLSLDQRERAAARQFVCIHPLRGFETTTLNLSVQVVSTVTLVATSWSFTNVGFVAKVISSIFFSSFLVIQQFLICKVNHHNNFSLPHLVDWAPLHSAHVIPALIILALLFMFMLQLGLACTQWRGAKSRERTWGVGKDEGA